MYDLRVDPKEQRDLSSDDPELAAAYRERFGRLLGTLQQGEDAPIDLEALDPDLVEKLRAMGYVR